MSYFNAYCFVSFRACVVLRVFKIANANVIMGFDRTNVNAKRYTALDNANTSVCEQPFRLRARFSHLVRNMNEQHFNLTYMMICRAQQDMILNGRPDRHRATVYGEMPRVRACYRTLSRDDSARRRQKQFSYISIICCHPAPLQCQGVVWYHRPPLEFCFIGEREEIATI